MKTYTITTEDDHAIKRAMQADSMAWVLQEFDEQLREVAKHNDGADQEFAQFWRDELRGYCHDNGIVIDDLFQ